ncbi:MAG: TonB family protein [Emticicia sp.]
MKKVFTSAIALSFSLSIFAQTQTSENSAVYAQASEVASSQIDLSSNDITKKYFNINREEVKSLDEAKFIQILKKNTKGLWDISEFYANGFLRMEGTFLDKKLEIRSGRFKFYRPNGIIDNEGVYQENNPTGEWKFYFPNGQMSSLEVYENGNRVKEEYWNEDGTDLINKSSGERLLPIFNGGQLLMSEYLKKNLQYPAEAVSTKTAGKVIVSFWVNEDGSITNPKIEESLGTAFDNSVLKMVNAMPKWLPAKHHNRPAKQMYILPVAFSYN